MPPAVGLHNGGQRDSSEVAPWTMVVM
uniref:Uncharacterized protein n=1 Tax=Anopheles albimanus TaxID=7167 RepID=A0A182FZ99_ANOAL